MAKRERFIVLDVGSTALHMGEFETTLAGVLELHAYDVIEYEEVMNEQNRILVLKDAIEKAIASGIKASATTRPAKTSPRTFDNQSFFT